MFEEDRHKFIPKRFMSLRSVPAYEKAVKESFDRCLYVYLCPRARKKRINIDPESLKPKLPCRKDIKPYPTHVILSTEVTRVQFCQYLPILLGNGLLLVQVMELYVYGRRLRIWEWEVDTRRRLRIWELDEAVQHVAWNPSIELPISAVVAGSDVYLLNAGFDNEELQKIEQLLHVETPTAPDDFSNSASGVNWVQDDKRKGVRLKHLKIVSSVEWHRKGDYFSTVMPSNILFLIMSFFFTRLKRDVDDFSNEGN